MYLSIHGAQQLRKLAAEMRREATGTALRADLRRDILAAMRPAADAVRSGVRATPTHGAKHTGLRDAVARATQVKIATGSTAGVTIEVQSGRMPAGKESLPRKMDEQSRWRHPVFGTNTWVNQSGHEFFYPAIRPHVPDAREAVVRAVERAFARLAS